MNSACKLSAESTKGEPMNKFYRRIIDNMNGDARYATEQERKAFVKREMAKTHTPDDGCMENE